MLPESDTAFTALSSCHRDSRWALSRYPTEVQFRVAGRRGQLARAAGRHFVRIQRVDEFRCDENQQFDLVVLLLNSTERGSPTMADRTSHGIPTFWDST